MLIVAREIGTERKIVIGYPERDTRWRLFLPRTSSVHDRSGSGGPRPQKDRSKADDQRETQTRLSLSDTPDHLNELNQSARPIVPSFPWLRKSSAMLRYSVR